jgi:hypothetical protein
MKAEDDDDNNNMTEMFAGFIRLYSEQNERHMNALLQALEIIDDSIQKGFSDVEEQLENIGDAIRDIEPESKD